MVLLGFIFIHMVCCVAHSSDSWLLQDSAQKPEKFPLPKGRNLMLSSWLSFQMKISLRCVCSAPHLNWENTIELRVRKSSKIMRGLFYVVLKTFWKSNYCLKFRITIFKIYFNLWTVEVSNIKHIDLYFSHSAIKIIADRVVRPLSYFFNPFMSLKHCFLILTIYLCICFDRSWV